MILIIYSKPFETALITKKVQEICKLVSIKEYMGRILADCSEARLDEIGRLVKKAESWTSEVKLKCKSKHCKLDNTYKLGEICLVNSRAILISKASKRCEVKIGPKLERKPTPPFTATLFYTSSLEDLKERIEILAYLEKKLDCSD